MQHSAEAMKQAANSFDDTLERHRRWMDDWLLRFEAAIEKTSVPVRRAASASPPVVCVPCRHLEGPLPPLVGHGGEV
jgi:hypothetical protein